MAVPVRKQEVQEEVRPALRLVVDNSRNTKATSNGRQAHDARYQDARPFRRVFAAVIVMCVALVVLGLGPVFLNAQATHDSQQAVLLQRAIDDGLATSDTLELRRSSLSSTVRVSSIATHDLDMVPATQTDLVIDLDEVPQKGMLAAALPAVDVDANTPSSTDGAAPENENKTAAKPSVGTLLAHQLGENPLGALARLTAGGSSSLLLGDVGLAATR